MATIAAFLIMNELVGMRHSILSLEKYSAQSVTMGQGLSLQAMVPIIPGVISVITSRQTSVL